MLKPHLSLSRIKGRLRLILKGPDPQFQTDRNIYHLYYDIFWWSLLGVAISFNSVYAIRLGASNTLVGLLSSIPALMVILLRFPAARMMECASNRVSLIARSLAAARSTYFLIALLPLFMTHHLAVAFVALVILSGIPANLAMAGWDALFADVVPEGRRANVVSVRNALVNAAKVAILPLAGQWLEWAPFPLNYQVLYLAGFVGGMLSLYHVIRLRPPERKEEEGGPNLSWELVQDLWGEQQPYLRFVVGVFVLQWAISLPMALYNVYYVRYLNASDGWIGLRSTLASLTPLIGYRIWPRLIDRWGTRKVLAFGASVTMLFPLLTGLSGSLTALLGVVVVHGLLVPAMVLGHYNMLLQVCPVQRRPSYIAGYAIVANIAAFLAPMLGVQLLEVTSIHAVFFIAAAIRVTTGLLFLRLPPDSLRLQEARGRE
ncbi:MAG: MFS transporter [Chloroflexota bacterium]|nr:MFS transporter [Chloroflexota bacterium]